MRFAICCLALGVLPALGQVAGIAVYTDFQKPPSPTVLSSLQDEVRVIASPLGLAIEWKSLAGEHSAQVGGRLVVAKFLGLCDTRGLPAPPFREGGLGRTHVSDREVLPFIDVDCGRIRGYLRAPLMQLEPHERDEVLGRALGRVFAHELYHVVARTTQHSHGSVDQSSYTVAELTDPTLHPSACQILHIATSDLRPAGRAGSLRRGRATFAAKLCNTCHGPRGEGTRRAPPLRKGGEPVDPALLAVRLGIDGPAMCRRAEQLKIVPPTLGTRDVEDLVRFLNAPPF